ncbi:ABC transporter ATP-binding protein [Arcticibacter tournemirensis]|uniref:ABC transporter ATP-binding protein n=1 Tax=Arcticibacter tournemirensis TaxID=699437 RepID=A0A5M9GWK3_9SPHI|nr:ABC transporter ATP-binding protein [Arcticibacter tournemirensis]KAA8477174.1 ABC transporter ATP-binding protein [Arcticibacter tournemirensis]
MLKLQKFRKRYGSYAALNIGDIEIPSGIFWIQGSNGSGKSTFLKALAGVLAFDGDILLDGVLSIKKQPVRYRSTVNFAEAEPLFPEFLTGTEMVRLFIEAKGGSPDQTDRYVENIGMAPHIHRSIGSFSSGMVKKLSLILAFIGKPQLILLDEPLITLDALSLDVLYSWIQEANRDHGVSFLLSSHQSLNTDFVKDASEIVVENKTLNLLNDPLVNK